MLWVHMCDFWVRHLRRIGGLGRDLESSPHPNPRVDQGHPSSVCVCAAQGHATSVLPPISSSVRPQRIGF
jgi:hypothetical protein